MKLLCTQENLNFGLSIVSHLSAKNINLPILNNILIETEDDAIKFSATNLEIGIQCTVRGKVEEEGKFTVDSRLLAEYVSLLPKDNVNVNLAENDFLKVDCKNYHTKMKGIAADEFPIIPEIEKNKLIKVKLSDLRDALAQVSFSVSSSETRQELSGVLFKITQKNLTLVGTDSYRLAEKKMNVLENSVAEEKKIIVPLRTLQELARILGQMKDSAETDEVNIYLSDNQILFTFDSIELISRLIEAQFPEYEQIIPSNFKTEIKCNKDELVKIIKTNALFSKVGIFDIALEFKKDTNSLVISSTNAQTGESRSELDVEYSGDDNDITLNYRYVLDGLANMLATDLDISMIDKNTPLMIKPKGEPDYVYIVMPIRQ